jgi:hypothetical protein
VIVDKVLQVFRHLDPPLPHELVLVMVHAHKGANVVSVVETGAPSGLPGSRKVLDYYTCVPIIPYCR